MVLIVRSPWIVRSGEVAHGSQSVLRLKPGAHAAGRIHHDQRDAAPDLLKSASGIGHQPARGIADQHLAVRTIP